MTWVEEHEGKVILGDCMEVMREIPDDAFDCTITDPPYGEKTHEGARRQANEKLITFDHIPLDQFIEMCRELLRITKRWIVMTCEWRYISEIEKAGLPLIRFGIWVKPSYTPQFTGDRPATGWEAVALLHRPGQKRWKGGGKSAVWTYNKTSGEHPTQKPLPLLNEWLRLFTDPGDLIFDPYCGSGSTLVAAKMMGRRFIGVELAPQYMIKATWRLTTVGHQLGLFGEEDSP